jgi:hypothetical protein
MANLKVYSSKKRFLKLLLIVVLVFSLGVLGLHIWFVNNARGVLKQIVATKSHGKIKLELSQLRFEFLSNKLQVREADLTSIDSIGQSTTYHVKFRKLTLRVNSFWPLILQKKLLLDSIKLHDPEIEVFQWRNDTLSRLVKDELSISQEMGKLYNSMLDVLDGFGIKRIMINNAKLSLINKMKPGIPPITISNIYFSLFRTADNVKKRDEFVKDEQSVGLSTTNQDIILPSGRHRLSFKNFNLELFQKRIVLDSCTVTKIPTEGSKSSYKIFFKRLLLIGADFEAMYKQNLIRADSVYCENPLFDIDLNPSDAVSKKKERPDPEKILRELTGDLDLAFVGVKDAGIHINISGKKTRSLFNSNKDDFEMRGLRINSDSVKPVQVDRFDMLVRDYRLYNADSSATYSFDSIHFINNKIALNNFSIAITANNKDHNKKDFRIPYFELTGLDWYELVFEENLKAREASLYNPVINYTKIRYSRQRKKINPFESLQSLDKLLALDKINIINGQIDMKMGPNTSLNFRNANIRLYSDRLLQSRNKEGLRKAVDELNFSRGIIKLKDITAELDHVRYTTKNFILADKVVVTSRSNNISASLRDLSIDNMLLDDNAEFIIIDGLRWDAGKISLRAFPASAKSGKKTNLEFKNISAGNTAFSYSSDKTSVTTYIQLLRIASFYQKENATPKLEGLSLAGKKFSMHNGPMEAKAGSFIISGDGASYITGADIRQVKGRDSLQITSPRMNFTTDINSFLAKDMHFTNVQMQNPVIEINKWSEPQQANDKKFSFRIDKLVANEPAISVSTHRNDSVTRISVPKSQGSIVTASGIKIDDMGVTLNSFSANTNGATFTKHTGEVMGVEKGEVNLQLSNIRLSQKDGKLAWSGLINNLYLQNPNSFAIGKNKNKLLFNKLGVGNVNLTSGYLSDFSQLLKYNVSAWLRTTTGEYTDSNKTLKWYNADYNSGNKTLSLDSFVYYPTQPRDSVIAHTPHQIDYITFKTGPLKIADFNLEEYRKDSALIAGIVDVTNPVITIYRDKAPPFLSGVIKPLPVDMIKNISLPVSIKRINLIDGLVSYTEKNGKTGAEGTILLTKLDGKISRVKNRNIAFDDSLVFSIDAYLMDSALIKLRVKESYIDPFSGFLMTLRMNPTSLTFLNPMIAPLSNVKIVSGTIDSFFLRGIGKEDIALGEVNMYYHDLRIKLYKNAELNQTTFFARTATFLANAFVIRKNNNGKTGIVYFERLRDRSFFNYIVKMTFSGMASSIGVKKNKKYLKQYERQLDIKNLPPITGLDFQLKNKSN